MTMPSCETLLPLGGGVFALLSLLMTSASFIFWRRAAAADGAQLRAALENVSRRLAALETVMDATKISVSDLGERFTQLQQVTSPVTAAAAGYQAAIRMARSGAGLQELIASCGLSTTEAELIQRLHGPGGRRGASRARAA